MISSVPTPTLQSQFLTEEQVAWILQVGDRTLRDWRKQRRIPFFKHGKNIVRYDPAAVIAFIMSNTTGIVRPASPALSMLPTDLVWQRIERLIQTAIQTRLDHTYGQPVRKPESETTHEDTSNPGDSRADIQPSIRELFQPPTRSDARGVA